MVYFKNKEGFHGHNRAKSRNDYSNSYRLSAKPSPPEKFRIRLKENAVKHSFSKHDNKQAFLNDPNLFSNGIGKKKVESLNRSKWNPEFIAWSDECGRENLKKSSYQNDFCNNSNNSKLLIGRKNFDNQFVSVYTCTFRFAWKDDKI